MSLSNNAKETLIVAIADEVSGNEIANAIDTSTTANAVNIAAEALNTTHRTSAGTDHSDVGLNNTHRTSDGTDHSDVGLANAHTLADGKSHSDVVLMNTHRTSDGKDHSDVVLNNAHRVSDGKNHSDVVLMNAHIISNGASHANVASNTAARNANWKIAHIMLATATDNTDAVTMALAVGDRVVEFAQDGNAVAASGLVAYTNEFIGKTAEATSITADTTVNSVDGDYFDITAKSGNLYRVYLDTTGGNVVIPAAGGRTLVRVDLSAGAGTAAANADLVAAALAAVAGGTDFTAPATGTGTVVVTDQIMGLVQDAVDPGMNLAWSVITSAQGASGPAAIGNALVHYKPIV